ncbi:MAG TPA: hypothetical protein VGG78_00515 [Gemmatimonadaceae bacterium]
MRERPPAADSSTAGKPTRALGSLIVHPPAGPPPPARAADTNKADQARLTRLEQEARALAKTDGCASLGSCRTAPVGWRGCGGPRTYIAYCAAATDTVALFRKLAELDSAEQDYNAKTGIASTCEMRLPPHVALEGKRCKLEQAKP